MNMKTPLLITVSLLMAFTLGQTPGAGQTAAILPSKTIVSKRTRNMDIVLTNDSGKLNPGENSFCVQFRSREPATRIEVKDVSIDFRLLVGRIEERPIRAQLTQRGTEGFCGRIDLGRPYYSSSNYYVCMRYMDARGKKRSIVFHLFFR